MLNMLCKIMQTDHFLNINFVQCIQSTPEIFPGSFGLTCKHPHNKMLGLMQSLDGAVSPCFLSGVVAQVAGFAVI